MVQILWILDLRRLRLCWWLKNWLLEWPMDPSDFSTGSEMCSWLIVPAKMVIITAVNLYCLHEPTHNVWRIYTWRHILWDKNSWKTWGFGLKWKKRIKNIIAISRQCLNGPSCNRIKCQSWSLADKNIRCWSLLANGCSGHNFRNHYWIRIGKDRL